MAGEHRVDRDLALREHDAERLHAAPRLVRQDVVDLAASLTRLRDSGERPDRWPVNDRLSLLLWEPAFATWQSP